MEFELSCEALPLVSLQHPPHWYLILLVARLGLVLLLLEVKKDRTVWAEGLVCSSLRGLEETISRC